MDEAPADDSTDARRAAEPSTACQRQPDFALTKTSGLNLRSILWFDPRREHSSVPTAESHSRRAQGLSRLAAAFAATRRAWP
jgi:hypothetical protein